jgi:hypothetical protein
MTLNIYALIIMTQHLVYVMSHFSYAFIFTLCVIMPRVIYAKCHSLYCYAECHTDCHYADCHFAVCHYAKQLSFC